MSFDNALNQVNNWLNKTQEEIKVETIEKIKPFIQRVNEYVKNHLNDFFMYDFRLVRRTLEPTISATPSEEEMKAGREGWHFWCSTWNTKEVNNYFESYELQYGYPHADGLVLMYRPKSFGVQKEAERLIAQETHEIYPKHVEEMREEFQAEIKVLEEKLKDSKDAYDREFVKHCRAIVYLNNVRDFAEQFGEHLTHESFAKVVIEMCNQVHKE